MSHKFFICTVILGALLATTGCQRSSAPAPVEVNHGMAGGQAYDLDLENTVAPLPAVHNSPKPVKEAKRVAPPKALIRKGKIASGMNRPDFIIVKEGQTLYSIAAEYKMSGAQIIAINHLQAPYVLEVGQKLYLKNSAAPRPAPAIKVAAASSSSGFIWPVQGRVITPYGEKGNEGVNIAAPMSKPVFATQSGKVAYVGNDLKDFGTMVLIHHGNQWKSAYAHLKKASVRQGDQVTQGQVIGYVGKSGNVPSPQLHFELRQGSQSVNPNQHMG